MDLGTVRRIFAIAECRSAFFLVPKATPAYRRTGSPKNYGMKKLFSLFAIVGIILASNCTRIPENDNAVIGIWSDVGISEATETQKEGGLRQEWIFNDAYLGRYHRKHNGSITFKTDFKWDFDGEVYTISYPGTDMEEETVSMQQNDAATILTDAAGNVMAIRE